MSEYAMVMKSGWYQHPHLRGSSDIVFKTKAEDLSAAKKYFVKLKDLDEDKFDELYVVVEVKDE